MISQYLDSIGFTLSMESIKGRECGIYQYKFNLWSKDKACSFDVLFRNRMMTIPAFIGIIESKLYENQLKEYFGETTYRQIFRICTEEVI